MITTFSISGARINKRPLALIDSQEKIQMKYQFIEAIMSSVDFFELVYPGPMVPYLTFIIDSCIRLKNCTALKSKLETIGKYKIN